MQKSLGLHPPSGRMTHSLSSSVRYLPPKKKEKKKFWFFLVSFLFSWLFCDVLVHIGFVKQPLMRQAVMQGSTEKRERKLREEVKVVRVCDLFIYLFFNKIHTINSSFSFFL